MSFNRQLTYFISDWIRKNPADSEWLEKLDKSKLADFLQKLKEINEIILKEKLFGDEEKPQKQEEITALAEELSKTLLDFLKVPKLDRGVENQFYIMLFLLIKSQNHLGMSECKQVVDDLGDFLLDETRPDALRKPSLSIIDKAKYSDDYQRQLIRVLPIFLKCLAIRNLITIVNSSEAVAKFTLETPALVSQLMGYDLFEIGKKFPNLAFTVIRQLTENERLFSHVRRQNWISFANVSQANATALLEAPKSYEQLNKDELLQLSRQYPELQSQLFSLAKNDKREMFEGKEIFRLVGFNVSSEASVSKSSADEMNASTYEDRLARWNSSSYSATELTLLGISRSFHLETDGASVHAQYSAFALIKRPR